MTMEEREILNTRENDQEFQERFAKAWSNLTRDKFGHEHKLFED